MGIASRGAGTVAKRFTNFDTLRLLAATSVIASVIASHSFLIAEGHVRSDPLWRLLGPDYPVGLYAVFVFFSVSGFLVSRSLSGTKSHLDLLSKRVVRIYPVQLISAVVSSMPIAAFFTSDGVASYFSRRDWATYIANVLLLHDPLPVKNVTFFDDGFVFGIIINGSLWTLMQEGQFYIGLVALSSLGCFTPWLSVPLMITSTAVFGLTSWHVIVLQPGALENFFYAMPSFTAGITMHFLSSRYSLSRTIASLCVLVLMAAATAGVLNVIFPVFGAYLVVSLGLKSAFSLGNVAKYGDVTYGTYLFDWPIPMIVRHLLGARASGWVLFAISLPLALLAGWLSCVAVETPTRRLRHLSPGNAMGSLLGRVGFRRAA